MRCNQKSKTWRCTLRALREYKVCAHHLRLNRERSRRNYAKRKQRLRAAKQRPCMDCGVSYPPYVMDFDHRDPSQKIEDASQMVNLSAERLEAEIAKCDLVCANCHRERTWG